MGAVMRRSRVGSVNERFAQRFAMDSQTGCWNWTGRVSQYGYGLIGGEVNGKRYVPKGHPMLAHRVAWIIFKGEIPAGGPPPHGYVVMHKCDNPLCVNPAHLELGTQADNVQDMLDKGRKVSGTPSGVEHWNSAFKDQTDIDLICATVGKTKELADRFGVAVCTIKRIRRRNGVVKQDAEKFVNKELSQEAIDHIRSTPPGTRGLGKLYGVGKTTIANIRKSLTHAR